MAEKMIIPEDCMAITVEDAFDMIATRSEYNTLLCVLYSGAKLSWDKKSLVFDQQSLNVILKALTEGMYTRCLTNLQKEESNGTD